MRDPVEFDWLRMQEEVRLELWQEPSRLFVHGNVPSQNVRWEGGLLRARSSFLFPCLSTLWAFVLPKTEKSHQLRGHEHEHMDVITAETKVLWVIPEEASKTCIEAWQGRLAKCIRLEGGCVERKTLPNCGEHGAIIFCDTISGTFQTHLVRAPFLNTWYRTCYVGIFAPFPWKCLLSPSLILWMTEWFTWSLLATAWTSWQSCKHPSARPLLTWLRRSLGGIANEGLKTSRMYSFMSLRYWPSFVSR